MHYGHMETFANSLTFPIGFIARYLGVLLVMLGVKGGTSMSTSAKAATNSHFTCLRPCPQSLSLSGMANRN